MNTADETAGTYTTEDERWTAVRERDPRAANAFVYAVTTTGVYCRPGCSSRRPNRANVRFFNTGQAAEAAGFRPCKRCEPQAENAPNPQYEAVLQACRILDESEEPPTLTELAAAVGLSQYHFHRLFKQVTGITPKAYAQARRSDRLRTTLQEKPTVTDALYEAGYTSSSRLYETADSTLGMTPGAYKNGGAGQTIRYAVAPSYLGQVLVAATERGICRIDLDDSAEVLEAQLREKFPRAELMPGGPEFEQTVSAVLDFLETPRASFDLPLDVRGTAFQQQVWSALQQIPPGSTMSYAEVAEAIGRPSAVRAVAGAVGANTLAVAIPCHRVIRSDGELGGYRWGLERKAALLAHEVS
ncbi:MAG: bifunctional DNA-binding transcriptional regulator/O6-methylguanine-DNA methyltransferase Ada [Chloroflexota bacterium]